MSRRRPSLGPPSSRPIRPILAAARGEAELARHGYVGLEHLLISLTLPEAPDTARLLAEHDLTTQRTRDAVWLVVGSGRGDGPRFDPATLLGTLGIDLDQIRHHIEAQFRPERDPHPLREPSRLEPSPPRTTVRARTQPTTQTRRRQRPRPLLG